MPVNIEFGVRDSEYPTFMNIITRLIPMDLTLIASNLRWVKFPNETDEPVQHVIIETLAPMVLLNFIASNMGIFLVAREDEGYEGVQMIVTDKSYPHGEYVELRYPG